MYLDINKEWVYVPILIVFLSSGLACMSFALLAMADAASVPTCLSSAASLVLFRLLIAPSPVSGLLE